MSDTPRPVPLPRLTVTLDPGTAQALALSAAARMQSQADFIRDAVAHELRVREAGAAAMRAEIARQGAAARRLAEVLAEPSPGRLTSRQIAALGRSPSHLTADMLDHAERTRPGKARP